MSAPGKAPPQAAGFFLGVPPTAAAATGAELLWEAAGTSGMGIFIAILDFCIPPYPTSPVPPP